MPGPAKGNWSCEFHQCLGDVRSLGDGFHSGSAASSPGRCLQFRSGRIVHRLARMRWAALLLTFGVATAMGPSGHTASAWVWPVDRPTILRGFEPPPVRWQAGHRGIDLAAPAGAQITSIGAGTVIFVGQVGGKPVVVVLHGTLRSTFEPVRGTVHVGDVVEAGDPIGILQGGHCTPVSCLHLGVRRGEDYVDPRALLSPARLVSGSPARG